MKYKTGSELPFDVSLSVLKYTSQSALFVDTLISLKKNTFVQGWLDQESYNKEIDLLTTIKLQIEQIEQLAKDSMKIGLRVDTYA